MRILVEGPMRGTGATGLPRHPTSGRPRSLSGAEGSRSTPRTAEHVLGGQGGGTIPIRMARSAATCLLPTLSLVVVCPGLPPVLYPDTEDSVKVPSMQDFGPGRALRATLGVAIAIAVVTGAGVVPMLAASAQITAPDREKPGLVGSALGPADGQNKAEGMRVPSDLGLTDEQGTGARTPTVIRRPRPAPVAAPASAAPAGDGWKTARVSWYGPGFYGRTMASGATLQPDSMVVAHRSLPFGTRIEFAYNGRTCVAVVMDRGPFVSGRVFDLGPGTAAALGFGGVGTVSYRFL